MNRILILLLLAFIFIKGFSQSTVWHANRITATENQNETNTWLDFRRNFHIEKLPVKTVAWIACDSKYWLWINGQLAVFEGQLKRGPNPTDTYFDEVNLSPYLKVGDNTIAILVWYFGKDGFSHKNSGQAGLVFQCDELSLYSDNNWLARLDNAFEKTENTQPNFRLSESNVKFDARIGDFNWVKPNAKIDDFSKAKIVGIAESAPWNKLALRPIPLWKDFGLKSFVNQFHIGDTIICVLPYNAQITPYLKIEAPAGKKITICTDNYLYFNGGGDGVRAEYITREGKQEYESLGWMNGHKVYFIIPPGIKIIVLKYRETGYDTQFSGNFHCSDTFFNKLWEKARRTLYLTMRDSYMDCPDRERAQWTGDAVNECGESFYALSSSSHALSKKWLHELIQWQRTDSSLYSPVPSGNWDSELPCQVLASVGYYGMWTYYKYTGDKQTISDLYTGVQRYLNIWEPDGKGTMKFRSGDWIWGDWGEECDMLLIENLWYYLAVKGLYNMAIELGKTNDATKYAEFMGKFKTSFNNQFWTGSAYRAKAYMGKTDDRTQALAVVSDIADKTKYAALLKVFQTEKHASPYMEKYVFEAMMQMGYENEAMERQKERFAKMVNNPNFTTLFEGWGIGVDGYGGGTVNHAWSGGGLTILSQYVCGIAPIDPGFLAFQVMPQPGNLTMASATVESVKGIIKSSYKKLTTGFEISVTVPDSTTAVVGVPSKDVKRIRLNNKLVWKEGKYLGNVITRLVNVPKDRIGFVVSPGEWQFISEYL